MTSDDGRLAEFQREITSRVAQGLCPHTSDTIVRCKMMDMCDCFDAPYIELPEHYPIGVTIEGYGPADDTPEWHHDMCICGDITCTQWKEYRDMAAIGSSVRKLSEWIDSHPANIARDPEARLWGRVAKVSEECGEVIAAVIGMTDQNPRKGITHTASDLRKELLDVAVTALVAVEYLNGNDGLVLTDLVAHLDSLVARIDVP